MILIDFFHVSLVQEREVEKVDRDGRAKSCSKLDQECITLAGEWSASLSRSTMRAREAESRFNVEKMKLPASKAHANWKCAKQAATEGHCVECPWMVLNVCY